MVLNNDCGDISTLVHEFGHNLNLGHAGDYRGPASNQAYADQIGYVSALLCIQYKIQFLMFIFYFLILFL